MENYITKLEINNVRHLKDIIINLGNDKKHLILTGKNGCGKTSVLEKLNIFIEVLISDNRNDIELYYRYKDKKDLHHIKQKILIDNVKKYKVCVPTIKNTKQINEIDYSNFIYAFFPATRINETTKPNGVHKIELSKNKTKKLNRDFMQYIVNLKTKQAYAQLDGDNKVAYKINQWFTNFEKMLQTIFSDNELKIVHDRDNFNFTIQRPSREEFDFNTLSAGYSAIVDIITELILKIETTPSKSFEVEGIVLIDEIENHLHVELQKNILPFLTTFFPNIQFIITTHSPFVLSSLENTVVYDLERKEQLSGDKLINASYTQIVKNYFQLDSEFSSILEYEIKQYEILINKLDSSISEDEEKELFNLDLKLEKITPMLSDVIYLKFKQLQDRLKV